MSDPRDVGNRPRVDALIPLMDALDRKEREAMAATAELRAAAIAALTDGQPRTAATLFMQCAEMLAASLGQTHHRVSEYRLRAADCQSLIELNQRRKRKGG